MSAEPIDFAAVKAEHEHRRKGMPDAYCYPCLTAWPCLPYRLAVEAERLAGKVARVEKVYRRYKDEYALVWDLEADLADALADQPERVQA